MKIEGNRDHGMGSDGRSRAFVGIHTTEISISSFAEYLQGKRASVIFDVRAKEDSFRSGLAIGAVSLSEEIATGFYRARL